MAQREPSEFWIPRTTRRLIPDLALVIAALSGAYCLLVFEGYRELFRDADSGWHIRTGERILGGSPLPRADPYSFTMRGKPWYAWEWGADLLIGAAHRVAGLGGVAWLFAMVIAVSVWLWIRLTWVVGGDFLLTAGLLPLFITASSLHWLARPHLLSWPLLVAAVWLAEKAPSRLSPRKLVIPIAFGAVWANVHASFFLGAVIGLLYGTGYWVRPALWAESAGEDRSRARVLAIASCLFAGGTLFNPYGWNLHRHVWVYLTNSDLLARIAEFQSFNFHAPGAGQILAVLVASFAGVLIGLAGRHPGRAAVSLLFTLIAMRSARGIPVAALLCLPLANGSLRWWLERQAESAAGWTVTIRTWLSRALTYSGNLRALDSRCSGLLWVPLGAVLGALVLVLPAVRANTGFSAKEFPVAAADRVANLSTDARLLSSDKFGGYLIYRFDGERLVFFDGRSDLYGSSFMKDYLTLMEVRPGWQEILARYHPSHALLPVNSPLRQALQTAGWRSLYSDEVAFLLERPGS